MRAELPVLSFISSLILIVSILSSRNTRTNFIDLCVIFWLLLCNIVHGVNSIIWADNIGIHIPVWCDIMTKFLLGAMIAIPAACLCISCELELLASSRKMQDSVDARRRWLIIGICLCVLLPFVFMSLQYLSQDRRFDLVANFGCFASTHPSILALSILWLPPLIICSISIIFSGFTLYHILNMGPNSLGSHLASRTSTASSSLFKRLIFSAFSTILFFVMIFFSFFSPPQFLPWTSFSDAHENFYDIDVLESSSEISSIEVTWWLIFTVTVAYICLWASELRFNGISSTLGHWASGAQRRDLLPIHTGAGREGSVVSLAGRQVQPRTVELKSGWDEMLHDKRPRSRSFRGGRGPLRSPSTRSTPSPVTSTGSTEDDAFMSSTLTYLNSSTACSLGLTSPVSPRAPSLPLNVSSRTKAESETSDDTVVGSDIAAEEKKLERPDADDGASAISSIWNVPWPLPPASIPTSPIMPSTPLVRSPSHASTDSYDSFGYALYPTITPPHLQSQPFQGPGVSPASGSRPLSPTTGAPFLKVPSVRRYRSREKLRRYSPNDVIYMTVVKESE